MLFLALGGLSLEQQRAWELRLELLCNVHCSGPMQTQSCGVSALISFCALTTVSNQWVFGKCIFTCNCVKHRALNWHQKPEPERLAFTVTVNRKGSWVLFLGRSGVGVGVGVGYGCESPLWLAPGALAGPCLIRCWHFSPRQPGLQRRLALS